MKQYAIHYDHPLQCWNVFRITERGEEFVRSFQLLEDAQAFVKAEAAWIQP